MRRTHPMRKVAAHQATGVPRRHRLNRLPNEPVVRRIMVYRIHRKGRPAILEAPLIWLLDFATLLLQFGEEGISNISHDIAVLRDHAEV